jgi:hypothetical protein
LTPPTGRQARAEIGTQVVVSASHTNDIDDSHALTRRSGFCPLPRARENKGRGRLTTALASNVDTLHALVCRGCFSATPLAAGCQQVPTPPLPTPRICSSVVSALENSASFAIDNDRGYARAHARTFCFLQVQTSPHHRRGSSLVVRSSQRASTCLPLRSR